jgi:hypothetical protein
MGTLTSRMAKLEATIREIPGPKAWIDLARDAAGVYRTIGHDSPFDVPPPFAEHLGAPVGLAAADLEAWTQEHRPGVSILVRRRGPGGGLAWIGPVAADWEPERMLTFDMELAGLLEEGKPCA